jgi:hypothetical protein
MRRDRSSACEPWACPIHCADTAPVIPALAAACFSLPFARRSLSGRAPCGRRTVAHCRQLRRGARRDGVIGYFLALHSIELAIAAIGCAAPFLPVQTRCALIFRQLANPQVEQLARVDAARHSRATQYLRCRVSHATWKAWVDHDRSWKDQPDRAECGRPSSPSPRVAKRAYAGSVKPG